MVISLLRRRNLTEVDPDVTRYAQAMLKRAGVGDRLPTPIDDVVACARLIVSEDLTLEVKNAGFLARSLGLVRSALAKVVGLVDLRENVMYVDPTKPRTKQGFVKLHECGHKVLPWQRDAYLYLDDETTLDPDVHALFERQANQFAAEVMFQGDRFDRDLADLPLSMKSAQALAKRYGSSAHAGIRRYVERHPRACAVLVLERVPNPAPNGAVFRIKRVCQSVRFARRFSTLEWPEFLPLDAPYSDELLRGRRFFSSADTLSDRKGQEVECTIDVFRTPYNVFVLVFPAGERKRTRGRIVIVGESMAET